MKPEVSVIIVTWNQPHYTVPCVKSVLKQEGNFEIIILDNHSIDNSVEIYKKEFGKNKKVKLIVALDNLGYAGGNNFGVKHAKGKYVVILNNDTTVEKEWLKELLRAIKSDKSIGAVNSLEVRNNKRPNLEDRRYYEMKFNVLLYGVKVKRKEPLKNLDLIDVSGIKGCSFIYRKDIINPPFDDDYFIYAEETKMAWMLMCMGYKIKLATKSVVNHYHNVTRKENTEFAKKAVFLGERNTVMNLLTFYDLWTTMRVFPILLGQIVFRNIIQPRKVPYRFKAYVWLITHGGLILKKRREIRSIKRLSDGNLLKKMTWKLWPRTSELYK